MLESLIERLKFHNPCSLRPVKLGESPLPEQPVSGPLAALVPTRTVSP